MASRYLFGPVSKAFAKQNLRGAIERGECLCFGEDGDFRIGWDDSWETLSERFPAGWQPDFVVLFLQYSVIPKGLWDSPVPIIGLAGDWNLQWHHYRNILSKCELVFTDTLGVETLAKSRISHGLPGCLYGCEEQFLEKPSAEESRSIDVLFVGNFHPVIQRERAPWLARVAQLSERWNIQLTTGVFGEDYRQLLRQSRIVFNRSIRGEFNNRVGEAIAAGALLFQEEDNREVPALLEDGKECVLYSDENLEERLEFYLEHEDERRAIAQAAQKGMVEFSFASQWQPMVATIDSQMPVIQEWVSHRLRKPRPLKLLDRTWQRISANFGSDPTLVQDLTAALHESPSDAALHNLQGVAFQWHNPLDLELAANAFQNARRSDPRHLIAGLNLVEILVLMGQKQHAADQALRTLEILNRLPELTPDTLEAPHVPLGYDWFRVEWERAAWANAGNQAGEDSAKRALLKWRLYRLLGDTKGDLVYYFQSHAARPDLMASQGTLGCALGRANRPADALSHLRAAHSQNPFDREIARAYFHVLVQLNLTGDQHLLIQERQNLAKAAPKVVPVDPWFAATIRPDASVLEVKPLRVVWQGSQQAVHSLALVNREICARLLADGHELSLVPATNSEPVNSRVVLPPGLQACLQKELSGPADVHISHHWPPDLRAPREGRWVIMQPWEFGSLPRAWIEPMRNKVDELWVPSIFVRECFVASGIPAEKV